MSVWQLALREIRHRRMNSAMTLLSITIAVGCLVGSQALLRSDEIETSRILSEKRAEVEESVEERQAEVQQAGKALEDATRKNMLKLGFNILILPEKQDTSELHLNGALSETMPEQHVETLANSSIITVNHLLPSVTKRITWPEKNVEIVVYGTRGEVPILHRTPKKELLTAVEPGTMVVGFGLQQKLGLKVDDEVELMGRTFRVAKLHPERGSIDDVTVWLNLKEAQELLGMENLINAILALECGCEAGMITKIRAEVENLLPGTQVIERYSQAVTRAEGRAKAAELAKAALDQEVENGKQILEREEQTRKDIVDRHVDLVAALVPVALVGCALWIALLSVTNVRQRTQEIGILRAIGLSSRQILGLLLTKSLITGLIGGVIGCTAGLVVGIQISGLPAVLDSVSQLFESQAVIAIVLLSPIIAPILAAAASWPTALQAARQDPAVVLQAE